MFFVSFLIPNFEIITHVYFDTNIFLKLYI